MNQLSPSQRELIDSITARLAVIPGVQAVVLGGSHARGRAQPDSDIDLGLLYSDVAPFAIESIRLLAQSLNDTPSPVVTSFYQWGPWVNGGAWLTIGGQRVDFLYRSLEHVDRVIADASAGRYELHYLQQPPFGFFSSNYLGEIEVCVPLFDPLAQLAERKQRVAAYPDALRRSIIQDFLFMAEFTLTAFAPKVAARADTYGTAACLARAVNELVMALFALNRRYPLNDKTSLLEIAEFEIAPREFSSRVQQTMAQLGTSAADLGVAVDAIAQLLHETTQLSGALYQSPFALPG